MNPLPRDAVGGASPDWFSSLFRPIAALRNRRALLAMIACMVGGVLAAGALSALAGGLGFAVGLLGVAVMLVASATGVSAAGVLLMEQAREQPLRPLKEALVFGLSCVPRFILLALALSLVALAVFIALAVLYLFCKIPVLGPMLFVVVFPLSVVVWGLTLCGLLLCLVFALPAIWEGATITHAIAQTLAIARSRPLEAMLLLAAVGVLAGAVGFIVFGVLFVGLIPAVGMAGALLDGEGLGSMLGVMRYRAESGEAFGGETAGGGYGLAAGVGGGLLWAMAGSLPSMVALLGLNMVYLRITEGLDLGTAEAEMKARFDDARRQAVDLGQKARDAADRARARASAAIAKPAAPPAAPEARTRVAPPESTTPAVAKALTCPHCLSAVGKDDAFCAVCGHKLT